MLTLDGLRARGESLYEEIARENYLGLAGLKPAIDLQSIYARYADITGPESLALAVAAFRNASGADERYQAGALLDWQIDLQSSRVLAPLDERAAAWEVAATVPRADGTAVPFRMISEPLATTNDRRERVRLESARSALVEAELAPIRLERLKAELAFVAQTKLGPTYTSVFETVSGISIAALCDQSRAFLRDTQNLWDELKDDLIGRILGIDPGDAGRADIWLLVRHREFDEHFSFDIDRSLHELARGVGLDPTANGRIVVDATRRAGKTWRAFCASVRVPREIYLVVQPQGAANDLHAALHEFGHAMHFAHTAETLGFESRRLGDASVTEGYAMLFDHLWYDAEWVAEHSTLTGKTLTAYLRTQAFNDLFYVRRFIGKLLYEAEVYGGEHHWDELPDRYSHHLASATGFDYGRADAFVDLDRRYYVVRYLRAWQLQAILRGELQARFGSRWWTKADVGPWMIEKMWSLGHSQSADALSAHLSGEALSYDELARSIRQLAG